MYGLGFPFILMGLQLCLEEGRQWAGKLAVLALSFCFFLFSYVYGNALDVQARYTDFRAGAAIADLTALEEFAGDGEKARSEDLSAVLKGIRNQRHVDADRIYLLGESNGCMTASLTFFDHPKLAAGLILVSPGFNPLEISRKARRFRGDILVIDGSQAMWNAATEIAEYVRR